MRLLALSLAAALALSSCSTGESPGTVGCGAPSPKVATTAGWIHARTPLYLVDEKGRLQRGTFGGDAWTPVSDHGFTSQPHVAIDRSHRWIGYQGAVGDGTRWQYWLFDLETGSDRLVLELTADAWALPSFSPDGRTMAMFVDPVKPGAADAGMYLVDTQTATVRHLPLPPDYPASDRIVGRQSWSATGDLLVWIGHHPLRGYRVSLADGSYHPIEAKDRTNGLYSFAQDGEDIELAEEAFPQSQWARQRAESADGKWVAEIDRQHRLRLSPASGDDRVIAQGSVNDCEGITIGVMGWVDGGEYVVYRLDDVSYVYGTRSGETALLFPDGRVDPTFWFFWHPGPETPRLE
jgi:hypothetical protein